MVKKAVVFDNSGTLIRRYKILKDLKENKLRKDLNSMDLIDNFDAGALMILQFNTSCLNKLNPNIKLYDLIKKHNINFDISYSNCEVTDEEVLQLLSENNVKISDITDGFDSLKKEIPNMEICNGTALILDISNNKVAYIITTAGKFFPQTLETINTLKNHGIEIFIASGDRAGAIKKLTEIFNIDESHGFHTADTKGKGEIVKKLQNKGFEVIMAGDAPNDVIAFDNADISILTIQQSKKIHPKLEGHFDYCIDDISMILDIIL